MKKLISAAVGMGMLLMSGSPAFAATRCQNSTTGFQSTNLCNTVLSKLHTLSLSNTGSVVHNVTKNVTSGNNTLTNNTVTAGLTVNSGNADAFVGSRASLNTASISLTQTDLATDYIGSNTITGPNSTNTVRLSNTKTATLNITNDGSVVHSVAVAVNSGGNTVSNNTIAGGIQTGNAFAITSVQTFMNSTTIIINL